jgi:hypothetical protein
MKVFAALHNPMVEESSAYTISLHTTMKGAEMAIEFSKHQVQEDFKDLYETDKLEWNEGGSTFKWDDWQWWGIKEIEILEP